MNTGAISFALLVFLLKIDVSFDLVAVILYILVILFEKETLKSIFMEILRKEDTNQCKSFGYLY